MARVSLNINPPTEIKSLIAFLTEISKIHKEADFYMKDDYRACIVIDAKEDCCFVTGCGYPGSIAVIVRNPTGIRIAWTDRPLIPSVINAIRESLHTMRRLKGQSGMDVAAMFNLCSNELMATLCVRRDTDVIETLMNRKEAISAHLGGKSKTRPRTARVANARQQRKRKRASKP